jgi:sulfur carrier protein
MKIVFNGEDCELTGSPADPLTVAELLKRHDIDPRQVAVEVNLELAPRTRHNEWVLGDGDRVEVVTLVGGG